MEPIALDRLTDLDAVLTEDEILARHTVRQFVRTNTCRLSATILSTTPSPRDSSPRLAPWGSWEPVSRAMAVPASTPLPMA